MILYIIQKYTSMWTYSEVYFHVDQELSHQKDRDYIATIKLSRILNPTSIITFSHLRRDVWEKLCSS